MNSPANSAAPGITLDQLYDRLVNEEDARVCKDIAENACRYVPVNFLLFVGANTLTKLGDELCNAKTVLAWLLTIVQAPVFLVGFLVPIRESGSMLPQLFIARYIRELPRRKWIWVLGSVLQGVAILGMGAVALLLTGAAAGWAIIALLVLFSLARGLCSVAWKDVLGKSIPKTRRGRLGGLTASISGVIAMAVGLYFVLQPQASDDVYALLLVAAACLWLIAAGTFARVEEFSGETSGGGNAITEALKSLGLLRNDAAFRRFVIVRALLLCSALTGPYYVVLASQYAGDAGIGELGLFILANGLASSLSAPFWGRWSDVSSKTVMIRATMLAALLGFVVVAIVAFVPLLRDSPWLYPLAFFVLGIAHSGVRLGRKTYIVDMAGGNKRTDYVAVSNTIIGFILLLTGFIGLLASLISTAGVILVLSAMGLTGALLGTRLPETQ